MPKEVLLSLMRQNPGLTRLVAAEPKFEKQAVETYIKNAEKHWSACLGSALRARCHLSERRY
eukprot:scaffold166242_cov13-Prasinocladus_malaysianus.AAC.1